MSQGKVCANFATKVRVNAVLLFRNARLFIILFVRNFRRVCSPFWLSVRNLFDVLLIEIQEEVHHFAGWGGWLRGTEIVNKDFVNKLAFPRFWSFGILGGFLGLYIWGLSNRRQASGVGRGGSSSFSVKEST